MDKNNYVGLMCFSCPMEFENVEQLCSHIQNVHKIRGDSTFTCTLCTSVLTEMNTFKRHLDRCLRKAKKRNLNRKDQVPNDGSEDVLKDGGIKLRQFGESIQAAALKFAVKLNSDMAIPRSNVFNIIEECRKNVVEGFVEGIKSVISPLILRSADKNQVDAFVQLCERLFCYVETESKLDSALTKADLLSAIRKFPIGVKESDSADESSSDIGSGNESDTSNNSTINFDPDEKETVSSDDSDNRFDCRGDERKKISTGTIMALTFQFRKFFEEKDVFNTLQNYAKRIKDSNALNHFINGTLWKSKLSAFSEDQIVIPYHLYNDETQINNVLGTHCRPGLESCVYYSFPTIPPQFASRLQNIFVAMFFNACDANTHGPNCCFEELAQLLNVLAKEGIKISVNGKEEIVFFVLGLFLGDNANLNKILGFNGFSDTFFCKHCKMNKKQTQTETVEDHSLIRTEENYDEDIVTSNDRITGIKWHSVFNTIFGFHVVHSAGVDIMHDISEGVLRYNMCAVISYFVKVKKFFTLKKLNSRKRNFVYDHPDRGNKSSDITMQQVKKLKLKMTASEMMTFFNNFGFLIGDLVDTEDEVWKFYLKTVEVVDLVYLTSFTEEDLLKLETSISEMNHMYKTLFNQTLKPKHHNLTHYPRLTRMFGPLRYISSMRFEAKHRMVKKYTKNIESRKNPSYSIGRKLQYDFANMCINGGGLQDKLQIQNKSVLVLSKQDFFGLIEKSSLLNGIADKDILQVQNLTMNGIFFSDSLFIPETSDDGTINMLRIFKVLLVSRGGQQLPYLLCEKYSKTSWNAHYACYETTAFDSSKILVLKNVPELLEAHILPVSLYKFQGKGMFRLRNY